MSEKSENIKKFSCKICNKFYSSQSSLCNHNKQFHINDVQLNVQNVQLNVQNVQNVQLNVQDNNKIIKCEYCNKIFKIRSTKSEHKKKSCKLNPNININNNELIELKNKNTELENSLKEIKELLINSKIHHKTLQKINNQLNNTTNNNNITINNTINLVSLGFENLSEVLNKKEKLNILKDMYGSLCKIVQYVQLVSQVLEFSSKIVHFNDKFPQFKTMLITNMQNNIAYKYDEDENRFITISKDELLNDLISIRLDDIIAFNEEVGEKLDINSKKKIETFLDTIDNNEKLREIKIKNFIFYLN
jgi:hypothetical protein